jgi:hypothetical protein
MTEKEVEYYKGIAEEWKDLYEDMKAVKISLSFYPEILNIMKMLYSMEKAFYNHGNSSEAHYIFGQLSQYVWSLIKQEDEDKVKEKNNGQRNQISKEKHR